jgi:hypothetical protein
VIDNLVGVYKYHTHQVIKWGERTFEKLCKGTSPQNILWRRRYSISTHAHYVGCEYQYTQNSIRGIMKNLLVLAEEGVTMPNTVYQNLQMAVQLRKEEQARLSRGTTDGGKRRKYAKANDSHQWIIESLEELLILFRRGPRIQLSILSGSSCSVTSVWDLNIGVEPQEVTPSPKESHSCLERWYELGIEVIDDWECLYEEDLEQDLSIKDKSDDSFEISFRSPQQDHKRSDTNLDSAKKSDSSDCWDEIDRNKDETRPLASCQECCSAAPKQKSTKGLSRNRFSAFLDLQQSRPQFESIWDAITDASENHEEWEVATSYDGGTERGSTFQLFLDDCPDDWEDLFDEDVDV